MEEEYRQRHIRSRQEVVEVKALAWAREEALALEQEVELVLLGSTRVRGLVGEEQEPRGSKEA